jgi:rfaE bifunctional protein kinase chain/domain
MTAAPILGRIRTLRALVAGDVCLDRWARYDPALSEPSRETGLPRVAVTSTEVTPGAAGTIANNLVALGVGRVAVLGARGDDGHGYELEHGLRARGIDADALLASREVATFTYTKLINAATQIEDRPRVDYINSAPLPEALESALVATLERAAPEFDVILVSDQAETHAGGVVTARLRDALARIATSKIVWVDSRMRAERFRGVFLKPNQDEARAALKRIGTDGDYRALLDYTRARLLVVTHGAEGALLLDGTGEEWVRTRAVEHPVDICGAGDSFSAGAAMALAAGATPAEAVRFGNLVASITIMKPGTGTASPDEVLRAEERLR